MRLNRRRRTTLLLLFAATSLLDCAAIRPQPPGERLFSAGNLPRAAEAFERNLVGTPSARQAELALIRLATIYAAPGETFDPLRSRIMLDRLLGRFPGTRFGTQARVLTALTDEVARLDLAVKRAREEIVEWSSKTEDCHRRIAELDAEVASLLQMGIEETASRRACDQALASLRRRVDQRDLEIGRLNDAVAALEALRRIDTEREPGN